MPENNYMLYVTAFEKKKVLILVCLYICIYTVMRLCFHLSATETPEVFTVMQEL